MRSSIASLGFGLALAALGLAAPAEENLARYSFEHSSLHLRAISPDNSCGAAQTGNYSCDATTNGPCCSAGGWCGSTEEYCSTGCQSDYGTCNTTPVTDSTTSCGATNGGATCATGYCCSAAGYCGTTTTYCAATNGCQSGYGSCNGTSPAGGGVCGPNHGNAICSNGQCCSVSGYCGVTQDYCSDPNNCLVGFGVCDSDSVPAGPSTLTVARTLDGPVSYTDEIYDCTKEGVVALTYDDGPYQYTEELLDVLKSYNFTATFFITGNNNGKGQIDITDPYPRLIQRMIAEGHQVASHTFSHYSLSNITSELRISQMVKNEMAISNIIGKFPTYMRPPYSQCSVESGCAADMVTLGYHRVYFDLDTQDYLNPLATQIQKSKDIVKAYLADKSVTEYLSIQHDIVYQSVANLSSYYFDLIQQRGFKGVTVGECLEDPEKNWYRSLNSTSTTSNSTKTATTSSSSASTSKSSVTTTTTSKSSTTTSKSSATPTTTSKSSATTSKTSTTTSKSSTTSKHTTTTTSKATTTTTTAAAAATCDAKIGTFCGTISNFTTKEGCTAATTKCNSDYTQCLSANGIFGILTCASWSSKCSKLGLYCVLCTTCTNAAAGY